MACTRLTAYVGAMRALLAMPCVLLTACGSLEEAVHSAFARAVPGDNIVLSPGFASFDMFRGYDDRGRQFESIVEKL